MTRALILLTSLALTGCAAVSGGNGLFGAQRGDVGSNGITSATAAAPEATIEAPLDASVGEAPPEDIAPVEPEARAAAVSEGDTAQGDAVRGFTVATLGDATVPGLWIETPLVDRERPATVVAPDGSTVDVAARPSGGAQGSGSRLSLAAFQALGLNLTSLPTVTVMAE